MENQSNLQSYSTSTKNRYQFSFNGSGWELTLLWSRNFWMTLLTLGIYKPWAKTNTRRYIWENIKFMGDRGKYTGTGGELFRGWIKLIGIFLIILLGGSFIAKVFPILKLPIALIVGLGYVLVFTLANYSGTRYLFSRTMWRQIRFGVDQDKKSTFEFLELYFLGSVFSVITLGLYYPIFKNQTIKFLTNKMRLGSGYFKYSGSDMEYLKINLIGIIASVVTFGILFPRYLLDLIQFRIKNTSFQGVHFNFTMKTSEMFIYGLLSYVVILFTFGMATPWVVVAMLKKIAANIYLEGDVDFSLITKKDSEGSAIADDLSSDYDLFLGF